MVTSKLTPQDNNWREQIANARKHLEAIRTQLVETEAELAERLAGINRFEFNLRTNVGQLVKRLEALDKENGILRRTLRLRNEKWGDMDGRTTHWHLSDFEASQTGKYRYRQAASPPPATPIDKSTKAEIKQIYRELAQRFHPDMGVDENDRVYRTQMMMAINAAYAARDLKKLHALALEPDAAYLIDTAQSDAQLYAAINQEVARCQRRLAEIEAELSQLLQHPSSQLMQQKTQAEIENRDFWAELEAQLLEQIARRQVERDVLKGELDKATETAVSVAGDDWADTVWDLTLEYAYDEEPELSAEEIIFRRRTRRDYDEDNPDSPEWEVW